jgi:alkylation response protein AidB-like acyl-CoA dehydrogenase
MIAFTEEEEAFRAEVRELLRAHPADGYFFQGSRWPAVRALFKEVGRRGWLAVGWPREEGGLGKGPAHEFILWDEMAYARAARPPLSAGIVAKTILAHGTPEQRARWLPPIRRAEIFFSLGYSETEAGSDLAALRTRAERRGDTYVVNGGKCWTSYAQHSDFLWTLCRTGAPDSRSRGLSLLILDLSARGVTVRPLPTIDGEQLNQIELDGVEVPADRRIGPENGAWRLVGEALAVERHVQFPPKRLRRDLEDLARWLSERGLLLGAAARERMAELAVCVLEAEVLALAVVDAMARGEDGTMSAAANKLVHTEVAQKIAEVALDLGGEEACAGGGLLQHLWRQSAWETIGGGTSEIMRSVIAREMGLPASK